MHHFLQYLNTPDCIAYWIHKPLFVFNNNVLNTSKWTLLDWAWMRSSLFLIVLVHLEFFLASNWYFGSFFIYLGASTTPHRRRTKHQSPHHITQHNTTYHITHNSDPFSRPPKAPSLGPSSMPSSTPLYTPSSTPSCQPNEAQEPNAAAVGTAKLGIDIQRPNEVFMPSSMTSCELASLTLSLNEEMLKK